MARKKKFIPIVIIIALIIAVPVGWKLYENKKEADRQALLNMGDGLQEAMDDYKKTAAEIDKNRTLAEEYTEIMESIIDEKVEVGDVKVKVCEMEEKLMEIYPTIYTEPSSVCK